MFDNISGLLYAGPTMAYVIFNIYSVGFSRLLGPSVPGFQIWQNTGSSTCVACFSVCNITTVKIPLLTRLFGGFICKNSISHEILYFCQTRQSFNCCMHLVRRLQIKVYSIMRTIYI